MIGNCTEEKVQSKGKMYEWEMNCHEEFVANFGICEMRDAEVGFLFREAYSMAVVGENRSASEGRLCSFWPPELVLMQLEW